ncbi:hypothetical protein ACI48J_21870 [Paenibacillus chitinolyticus]|uniref:hypothetical protein n=1 Tax=Paenibacillus chitinolyticus TaxID=79263 RepID=UPI002DBDD49E|nr:hypothetical protein [Paenibacillus chitinolyticus]MEC0246742.1 hypothetical protein [Paenibacillus chitinolyticus]
MFRIHLTKRTIVPNYGNETEEKAANGAVKTYFLKPEELDYYRSLPTKKERREFNSTDRVYLFKKDKLQEPQSADIRSSDPN